MVQQKFGILAMACACVVWGLSPLYYKLLEHIAPLEILAHRTFWSFATFAVILGLQGRLGEVGQALRSWQRLQVIAFAALMISVNWFLFILSIQIGKATEASLGYYIFPLVAVVFGVVAFGERLGRLQWIAVALATAGVLVLTIGQGVAPWISLILAVTFGLYGLVKKKLSVGPVVTVTAEVALLLPVALGWMLWIHSSGQAQFGAQWGTSALMAFSGVLTAVPLILFSRAAQQVPLATVGLVQYINPTLQFLCATLAFGEPLGWVHVVTFAMIWSALAIYSVATLRAGRK
jgi:chloramphenicol-sensitive protein RarD